MHIPGRLPLALSALAFIVAMVLNPATVFDGATLGLQTWWEIVFPSLLPFFIVSELLMGLGVVRVLGILLEPVMRPLFGLPGAASFPIAVGYSSGYPIGGAVTARLRAERLVTRGEAEHLVAFTNNASPLFILVALAVGMFKEPAVGPFILGIHYSTNLILGFMMRFFLSANRPNPAPVSNHWQRAWQGLSACDTHPVGKVLGEAIRASVQKLLVIGGFIIFFAVIIRLLARYGILGLLAQALGVILVPFGLDLALLEPLATGFFEMSLGTRLVAESPVSLRQQLVAIQLILAWSGLSIQAQVAGFTAPTDIRLGLYVISRAVHAALAGLATYFLFPLWEPTAPALAPSVTAIPSHGELLCVSASLALLLPLVLAALALAAACMRRLLHSL